MQESNGVSGNAAAIRDAIRMISNPLGMDAPEFLLCEVVSVDEDARTCVCKPVNDRSANEIPDVNLLSVPNDGVIMLPSEGSVVLVLRLIKSGAWVLRESDLSKYLLIADEILFQSDSYGGVPIAGQIASQTNAAINVLKTACIAAFTALSGLDGSASLNAFNGAVAALQPLNETTLQNDKVKHGQ